MYLIAMRHSRPKCPGSSQKLQLPLVCPVRGARSAHTLVAVAAKALTNDSVMRSRIVARSSVLKSEVAGRALGVDAEAGDVT